MNQEMNACPMASMCKGMTGRPGFGLMLLLPGVLLVLAGIVIFIEPKVLVWLIASVSILFGLVMLFFALFIRRMAGHFTNRGA
jgi:uncharacterized membrane protein HdeD (DUF308 family)